MNRLLMLKLDLIGRGRLSVVSTYLDNIKKFIMKLSKHISVSGLMILAFVLMSAIVFLTEDQQHYWTLLLFIPLLLFLTWMVIRKESPDMGE